MFHCFIRSRSEAGEWATIDPWDCKELLLPKRASPVAQREHLWEIDAREARQVQNVCMERQQWI